MPECGNISTGTGTKNGGVTSPNSGVSKLDHSDNGISVYSATVGWLRDLMDLPMLTGKQGCITTWKDSSSMAPTV
jgi:hypothetical protein